MTRSLNESIGHCWRPALCAGITTSIGTAGIQYVTPEQRHTGEDREILKQRQAVYEAAKGKKPERWSHHPKLGLASRSLFKSR
ncbi:MAG: hypothetical protein KJ725_05535 [Gammaproteobacteria bacterium]|nr:hypothetical protein [Gammaproteobacteria bacterium]